MQTLSANKVIFKGAETPECNYSKVCFSCKDIQRIGTRKRSKPLGKEEKLYMNLIFKVN